MGRGGLTIVVASALSLAVVTSALGQKRNVDARTEQRAVDAYERGKTHYDLAEYDKAIEAWKAGYELNGDPMFLLNLGIAFKAKNDFGNTLFFYRRFLAVTDKDDPMRTKVEKRIAELEQLLREQERAKEEPPKEPTQPPPPPPEDVPAVDVDEAPADEPTIRPWYDDTWGWVLVGSGVAVAGGGIWSTSHASSLNDEADREIDQARAVALRDDADTFETTGTVLLIGGAALVTTGVVKLILHDNGSSSESMTTVACGLRFCSIRGSF